MTNVLEIQSLGLTVPSADGPRPLLRDVSLSIAAGTSVGLVGESGSGKSLTARSVIGLLPPGGQLTGEITVHGVSLTGLGEAERRAQRGSELAMVFQDPRAHINPVRRIGDHMTEALRFFRKVSAEEARSRAQELLRSVNLDRPERIMRLYPHEVSGGMLQRVMIAGALTCEPSLLLADEPTTALDTTTQAEVMGILRDLQTDRGMAVLFITHDLELAAATCDRTVVMYAGSIMEEQVSEQLQIRPIHPYSSALLHSRPSIGEPQRRLPTISGRPVSAAEVTKGCPFSTRCAYVEPRCEDHSVPIRSHRVGRVACLRADELSLTGNVVNP
jgi:oligopeptide/dipeptide ABC transporter ATP-binding protein